MVWFCAKNIKIEWALLDSNKWKKIPLKPGSVRYGYSVCSVDFMQCLSCAVVKLFLLTT